ncbi:hypothetical protein CQW23_06564 [Capsicum baccatum]|uniref:Histidine-containing phosphotransfer protein n=1 Tax=Capsicum baccatum TaxID=33114 RepID=A0A2G2X3P5_CAPBA|nr:hypothetical protein CQW23_06564 [Capsicum baccatum]
MADQFAQYVADLRQSLIDERILDGQFLELERYVANTPGRLEEICAVYFRHAVKFTDLMVSRLQGPPYNSLSIDWILDRYREKTSIFGATRVTHQIDCMRKNVKDGNFESCKIAFEHIKWESEVLQLKVENYLKVKNQDPPIEIEDQPDYGDMNSDSE